MRSVRTSSAPGTRSWIAASIARSLINDPPGASMPVLVVGRRSITPAACTGAGPEICDDELEVDRVAWAGGKLRHQRRQVVEFAFAGNQRVEDRIRKQRERQLHTAARIPARSLRRRDSADLGRFDRQSPRMKSAAEQRRHRLVAIPAQLDDRRFEACDTKREIESRR